MAIEDEIIEDPDEVRGDDHTERPERWTVRRILLALKACALTLLWVIIVVPSRMLELWERR